MRTNAIIEEFVQINLGQYPVLPHMIELFTWCVYPKQAIVHTRVHTMYT